MRPGDSPATLPNVMESDLNHLHGETEGHEYMIDGGLTVPVGYQPEKAADVLELDMEDGFILFNHDSSLVHHLNPSAAIIWQLCDGSATISELAADVSAEFHLDRDETIKQLVGVIAELDALGLVKNAAADDGAVLPPS
jgi:PqqD family protein of HPr-rel-A system